MIDETYKDSRNTRYRTEGDPKKRYNYKEQKWRFQQQQKRNLIKNGKLDEELQEEPQIYNVFAQTQSDKNKYGKTIYDGKLKKKNKMISDKLTKEQKNQLFEKDIEICSSKVISQK